MTSIHSEAVRSTWTLRYLEGRERVLGRQAKVPVHLDAERQVDALAEHLSVTQLEALADAIASRLRKGAA